MEALLDSGATGLVMSSEFTRKQGFKLKKLERPMQVRNVDGSFNKEGPIENTVEVNVYYKGHVERTEIDMMGGQKWSVILGMLWLARHNPEINWKTGEVKMTWLSRSLTADSILFSLFILFYFSGFLSVYFSIFRTARVRGYQSRCHISHNLMA